MKRFTLLKTMLLLCALIVGSVNGWATDPVTIASFTASTYNGGTTGNWTVNNADYATTGGGYYMLTYSNCSITTPSINWSSYSNITITIAARMYGGPSNSQKVIYVKQGSTELATYSPDGTSIVSSGALSISPSGTGSLTIVCSGASSNKGSGVQTITIKGTPTYSITAVSNNDSWGTVSGTTTITAEPADGYRVKAGDEGYTVTSGTATVTNNGDNTFSVSASTDCTVQINFEAIPTRTITVTPTSDGTITVKNGDDVVSSGSSIREGTELTISAVAGANKEFASWSVTGATPASETDTETTFTVGESNVTIAALFNTIVTHEISWSVNGTIVKVENVKEGNALSFAAPASGSIPAGYVFKGWSESAILTPQATETGITYVSSGTSTEDVTYYAVLAVENTTSTSKVFEITNKNFTDNISGSYGEGTFKVTHDGKDYTITYYACKQSSMCQLKDQASPVPCVGVPTLPGNITKIETTTCANASGSGYTGTIHIKSLRTRGNANTNDITKKELSNATSFSIDITGEHKSFYLVTSAGLRIQDLKVTYTASTTTTSNYCTSIPNASVTITSAKYATFCDNVTRDFSESGITVYTAESDGSKVTLTEVEDGVVPDGEGVILFCETADTYTVPATTKDATNYEGLTNEMVGVLKSTLVKYEDGTKKNFILAKNAENKVGFMKATVAGANMPANRAYLSITVAPAREFLFFDDETTGINAVENSNADVKDAVIYNLNGQRVMNPTKGLYIVNGKKVMFNK